MKKFNLFIAAEEELALLPPMEERELILEYHYGDTRIKLYRDYNGLKGVRSSYFQVDTSEKIVLFENQKELIEAVVQVATGKFIDRRINRSAVLALSVVLKATDPEHMYQLLRQLDVSENDIATIKRHVSYMSTMAFTLGL